ncbi:MAG: methyltransferase domain-containing protein [Candidatus Thermoplasmatota archaeon]|jgi:SAM-dependent methyltransferase|nr:methyltransferase domain-containing protein [Candidatus Thermoplasmatota archaeon]MDP7264153.1 methyltransferase domain-containing protein [Candidatus Thermoplasmatota archaeon]
MAEQKNQEKNETIENVQSLYSEAALMQKPKLCCPTGYAGDETSHIPKEVLDVSYGCGNPTTFKVMQSGMTLVDLGSGAGIDCFIASKKVGRYGKVIGIDMTDNMLEKASRNKELVASRLGFDNVEFRKGQIDNLPVADKTADLVISNCVINLAVDKGKVFEEIHRVLKDEGLFCVSDIVASKDVPQHLKDDKKLWGECVSGALETSKYLQAATEAGFYGLQVLKSYVWQAMEGINFISITLKGHKLKRSPECIYQGQTATYNGPGLEFKDDEDHTFKRGIPLEICMETAKRLNKAPYDSFFSISGVTGNKEESPDCSTPTKNVNAKIENDCGPGCC